MAHVQVEVVQRCRLCIRNHRHCPPECPFAPFFPTHMVTETNLVNSIFTTCHLYITLFILETNHLQLSSSILYMKNLFKEAHLRSADPIRGPLKSLHFRLMRLSKEVSKKNTKIRRLRRELNKRKVQVEPVFSVEEEGNELPPPPS